MVAWLSLTPTRTELQSNLGRGRVGAGSRLPGTCFVEDIPIPILE